MKQIEWMKNPRFIIPMALILLGSLVALSLSESYYMMYNIILLPFLGILATYALGKNAWIVEAYLFLLTYIWHVLKYIGTLGLKAETLGTIFLSPLMWALIYVGLCAIGTLIASLFVYASSGKTKNKKNNRALAVIGALILIGFILFVTNSFYGNPISSQIAKNKARHYAHDQYPSEAYEIEQVQFDFKQHSYLVNLVIPDSPDRSFTVYYSPLGEFERDDYAFRVEQKMNVYDRLNREYREYLSPLFDSGQEPFHDNLSFSVIEAEFKSSDHVGLDFDTLTLGQSFDLETLGKEYGRITLYVVTEHQDAPTAAKILRMVDQAFQENNLFYNRIDLSLEKETAGSSENANYYAIYDFPRTEISSDGLEEKVEQYHEKSQD